MNLAKSEIISYVISTTYIKNTICSFKIDLGEQLVLLVEAPATEKTAMMTIAQQHLGANKYHIPKQVICMDAFMHTRLGKLDRKGTIKRLNM